MVVGPVVPAAMLLEAEARRQYELLTAQSSNLKTVPDHLLSACTRTQKNPVCSLSYHLTVCNEALWHVGLELKEDTEGNVGELRLLNVYGGWGELPGKNPDVAAERVAVNLLQMVFTKHHCVVDVELNVSLASRRCLLRALEQNRCVRTLRVQGIHSEHTEASDNVFNLVASAAYLQELIFSDAHCSSLLKQAVSFLLLEGGGSCLKTLDVAALRMSHYKAKQLISGLRGNHTIEELAVGASVFTCGSVNPADIFGGYLRRENAKLKKLTLRSRPYYNTRALHALVETLAKVTTLQELTVDLSLTCVEDTVLFARVMALNRTLKSLSVTWLNEYYDFPPPHINFAASNGAERMGVWLDALRQNSTLANLTIDLVGFAVEDCCRFFRALAGNQSLVRVSACNVPGNGAVSPVCQAIKASGPPGRVFVKDYDVCPADLASLASCDEVGAVNITNEHLPHVELLRRAFTVLVACRHVTAIRVRVCSDYFDRSLHTVLADYIAGAPTLKEIDLHLDVDLYDVDGGNKQDAQSALVNALISNTSIARIALNEIAFSDNDCRRFAGAILRSKRLNELTFGASWDVFNVTFLRSLAAGAAENFSLLHVEFPLHVELDDHVEAVQHGARRNSSLVKHAARFVMGDRDFYSARALELVAEQQKLVEIVQSQAGVGAAEAARMIRQSLRLMCLQSLDGYMKLAGVVKHSVECCGSREDGLRLTDLYEDCWLHIRQFIKIADVALV